MLHSPAAYAAEHTAHDREYCFKKAIVTENLILRWLLVIHTDTNIFLWQSIVSLGDGLSSGVSHVIQGSGAYAPEVCSICCAAVQQMLQRCAAYAPQPCSICSRALEHMLQRLFWQYFFCRYFERSPMKLIQYNAYGRGKIASILLDSYRSGKYTFWFFLIRFWPVLSPLCAKIPPKSSKFWSKPCKNPAKIFTSGQNKK